MVRARPALPKLAHLPPPEADLQELLYRFEEAVHQGEPCSFALLRKLWQAMQFSFVFETRLLETTHEDFVQSLFAAALDCLEVPLRPRGQSSRPQVPAERAAASQDPEKGSAPSQAASGSRPGDQGAEPSGRDSRALHTPRSLSLADLVASDEDEDDAEDQQQIAHSLMTHSAASQARSGSAEEGPLDLTALEMLSDLPELMGGLGAELTHPPPSSPRPPLTGLGDPSEAPSLSESPPDNTRGEEARAPDPGVVRIGSIFLLYALYHAQPACQLVRIYLPLHLLRGLTWMVGQSAEADAVLRRMVAENAFVIGAVRQPISGSREALLAGRSTKVALATDRIEQRRQRRQALVQLKASSASWSSLQHIQLLCNSYKAAQQRLWARQKHGVQGLFDLETGNQLGALVSQMQERLTKLLPYHNRSMFLASEAQMQRAQERIRQPIHQESEEERQAKLQAAAARRRQRWVDEQEDDMPSLTELGISGPGSEVQGAVADPTDALLPRAARMVEQRRMQEDLEARRCMATWKQAYFDSSRAAAELPTEQPRSRPSEGPEPARQRSPEVANRAPAEQLVSVSAMATSAGSWSPSRSGEAGPGPEAPPPGAAVGTGGRRPKRQRLAESIDADSAAPVHCVANGTAAVARGRAQRSEQTGAAVDDAGEQQMQTASKLSGPPGDSNCVRVRRGSRQSRAASASVPEVEDSNLVEAENEVGQDQPPQVSVEAADPADRALQGLSDIHAEVDRLLEGL